MRVKQSQFEQFTPTRKFFKFIQFQTRGASITFMKKFKNKFNTFKKHLEKMFCKLKQPKKFPTFPKN